MNQKNLIGQRFGRLVVLSEAPRGEKYPHQNGIIASVIAGIQSICTPMPLLVVNAEVVDACSVSPDLRTFLAKFGDI